MEKQNKDLIIQDQKNVIVDYKSKLMKSNTNLTDTVKRYNKEIANNNEIQFKLINDLNICQSANKRQTEIIEELKLDNKEVNKLKSTYKFSLIIQGCILGVLLAFIYLKLI
jgi:hemerythrin superfamily protein